MYGIAWDGWLSRKDRAGISCVGLRKDRADVSCAGLRRDGADVSCVELRKDRAGVSSVGLGKDRAGVSSLKSISSVQLSHAIVLTTISLRGVRLIRNFRCLNQKVSVGKCSNSCGLDYFQNF